MTWTPKGWTLAEELAMQPLAAGALALCRERKVRAPQDRAPGNAWEARAYGKCSREQTAANPEVCGKGERVR